MEDQVSIRQELTPDQRSLPLLHTIDPGFVHHRRIQTAIGPRAMKYVDERIRDLPDMADWQREVRINHIYTQAMLGFCRHLGVAPLQRLLATERGRLCCSTEEVGPSPDVYDQERSINLWIPRGAYPRRVEFHYSTRHICSDTMRSDLYRGSTVSIVAELHSVAHEAVIFRPIAMGSPWLEAGDTEPDFEIMWWGLEYFENFVEDFDEFSEVVSVPTPESPEPMRQISERAFKHCLAQILGDQARVDWGGETSDHFSAHVHLRGTRATAAFLLKGPARFEPMNLNHLGKNSRIVSLCQTAVRLACRKHGEIGHRGWLNTGCDLAVIQ